MIDAKWLQDYKTKSNAHDCALLLVFLVLRMKKMKKEKKSAPVRR